MGTEPAADLEDRPVNGRLRSCMHSGYELVQDRELQNLSAMSGSM